MIRTVKSSTLLTRPIVNKTGEAEREKKLQLSVTARPKKYQKSSDRRPPRRERAHLVSISFPPPAPKSFDRFPQNSPAASSACHPTAVGLWPTAAVYCRDEHSPKNQIPVDSGAHKQPISPPVEGLFRDSKRTTLKTSKSSTLRNDLLGRGDETRPGLRKRDNNTRGFVYT